MAIFDASLSSTVAIVAAWAIWKAFSRLFPSSPVDNLPGPISDSFLRGNLDRLFDRHGWAFLDEIGERYGPVVKLTGPLGRKLLFVFDPKALHQIVLKDQYIYDQAGYTVMSHGTAIGPALISTVGERHKQQRKMLNPVFSIGHMRRITPIFYRVAFSLREAMKKKVEGGSDETDVLHWMHRIALELIGQGGLGYSFDSLVEDHHNVYGDALKQYLPALFSLSFARLVWYKFQPLASLLPKAYLRWVVNHVPSKRLRRLKDISDTMHYSAASLLHLKQEALEAGDEAVAKQVGEGKDIISTLLRANMETPEDSRIPEEDIIAQMSFLVLAATDTASNSLTQIMHSLAAHPEAQERLRNEILEVRKGAGAEIPYDTLMSLPYMDAVCRETLRLYPPVSFVSREAQKDVVLPLSRPILGVNGQLMQEVPIPKGTAIIIGIRASNLNKELWGDDAKEWKPERWLAPLPAAVNEARIPGVYSNQMTFVGGVRSCIGFKFSQLEIKVVLSVLLESFRFSLSKNTADIHWNLAAVRYPTVGKDSSKPEFPMMVEVL